MDGVDPKAFEFALSRIEDGFVFENFANTFLAAILGYNFIPVGGLKDRGIDGLEHIYHREGYERNIYQISIEKHCEGKLETTISKLKKNKAIFDQLYFVTNQNFPNKDKFIDEMYDRYRKNVHIYDLTWLSSRVNSSPATVNIYQTFIQSYLHEFNKPGRSYVVSNLVDDPRLFVFLRQQWEGNKRDHGLDEILADTLIIYSLEGTNPELGIFKNTAQIKKDIATHIKFDPKLLSQVIDRRLDLLSKKPRRINYHVKEAAYCLPYETRLEIQNRNLVDADLHDKFTKGVEARLESFLKNANLRVRDCSALIEVVINKLFYAQGLEFSDFILHGENQEAFEKDLPGIISSAVDRSSVVDKNKEEVKTALLTAIRDLIYNGSTEEQEFLRRLSNTYMMMFLIQCDPKLATYFNDMAAKLSVYVDTSVLIPALSEYYLEPINRRHWNLLTGARAVGVTLIVNDTIIDELSAHFRMVIKQYDNLYKSNEAFYVDDEIQTLYIEQIMIRAYFYSKSKGKVADFSTFLDSFIGADSSSYSADLLTFLKDMFGIVYRADKSLSVTIDKGEESMLSTKLEEQKKNKWKANNDAKLILTIYAIREKNNEMDGASISGYRTWWLSTDKATQRSVNDIFKSKYKVSCYIRPDFLYNYISLAPSMSEVDAVYQGLFPSLVGVNISFHLPKEVTDNIHTFIKDHRGKNPTRIKAILRDLAEKIKSDPQYRNKLSVEHYLDEQLNSYQLAP